MNPILTKFKKTEGANEIPSGDKIQIEDQNHQKHHFSIICVLYHGLHAHNRYIKIKVSPSYKIENLRFEVLKITHIETKRVMFADTELDLN